MQTTLPPRRRRRFGRLVAGAALALSLPAVAGCGFNVQTDKPYQPGVGSNDRSSQVDVLGAVVVSADPGSGTFIVSLVNKSTSHADRLVSIQGSGVQVAGGTIPEIPADGLVNFADTSVGGVQVKGATVKPGGYLTLRLSFENADPVSIDVPVVTDTGPYAGLAASASPTATPSAGASSSPSASASESPAG